MAAFRDIEEVSQGLLSLLGANRAEAQQRRLLGRHEQVVERLLETQDGAEKQLRGLQTRGMFLASGGKWNHLLSALLGEGQTLGSLLLSTLQRSSPWRRKWPRAFSMRRSRCTREAWSCSSWKLGFRRLGRRTPV
ncbi:SPC24 component of NDC80 kinetochore complex [Homo sapiens]|uniref:Kinetochore protein Spc24 n=1 Tax=Homo sapiens TaxID=9606 RepID=A0A0A0MSN0_HUMAN|nr:SPC24 component of NDC80 kinetochore complex [Homo sapiens]KAI4040467.1 SPC24 component of NDC80 kinetochore complex [Homo sapiens]